MSWAGAFGASLRGGGGAEGLLDEFAELRGHYGADFDLGFRGRVQGVFGGLRFRVHPGSQIVSQEDAGHPVVGQCGQLGVGFAGHDGNRQDLPAVDLDGGPDRRQGHEAIPGQGVATRHLGMPLGEKVGVGPLEEAFGQKDAAVRLEQAFPARGLRQRVLAAVEVGARRRHQAKTTGGRWNQTGGTFDPWGNEGPM